MRVPQNGAHPPEEPGPTIRVECRRAAATHPRQVILLVTVLLGVLAAVAVGSGAPASERTFVAFSEPVQSAMSVTLPFLGVLLAVGLRRPAKRSATASIVLTALLVAVVVALFGIALCSLCTALVPGAAPDRWRGAVTIAIGSVLVQCTAQSVGTGLGLVLGRRPVVACLAGIMLPLGLWFLLGVADVLHPARQWLTPYASAQNLLSGHLSPVEWAQWLVTATVWGLALNLFGMRRARHEG